MSIAVGRVEAIFRYPVKSMAGERLESAALGWHGLEGDRRLALRRRDDRSGFPWLTASRVPRLFQFVPFRNDDDSDALVTHVRTPEGNGLPIFSTQLAAAIEALHGSPVEMTHLKHGIYDDACLSVIAAETVQEIARLSGSTPDVRRFRPNVLVSLQHAAAFAEDDWLGATLSFGDGPDAPAIAITMKDTRCAMVNLDPDSAHTSPDVLKAIVRANENHAGVYAAVTRTGRIEVGQRILLRREG